MNELKTNSRTKSILVNESGLSTISLEDRFVVDISTIIVHY